MDTYENKDLTGREEAPVQEAPVEQPAAAPEAPAPERSVFVEHPAYAQHQQPPAEPIVRPYRPPQDPAERISFEVRTPQQPVQPAQAYRQAPVYNQNTTYTYQPGQPQYTAPVYNPYQTVPQYRPVAPRPPRKKANVGFWIAIALLVLSLAVQTATIFLNRGGSGIASAQINDKGELVLTYTNGTTDNLGVVVGDDGANGKDGTTTVVTDQAGTAIAISNGLRSSVSIYCTFTTEQGRWGQAVESYAAGSGVIYSLDKSKGSALIITNYHVVYDAASRNANGIADDIAVYLYGSEIEGMEMKATYVGGSMYYDLAVLHVEGSNVLKYSDAVAVTVANSDAVQVGSKAIAIGNAEGSGISATSGVVSVDSEYISMTGSDGVTPVDYRVMRIDTAVNSGNSGGGLFDENGNLIGIVNAKTMEDGVENIGYALPSSVVAAVADNIIDYCFGTDCENVMRPMMGVTVMTTASNAVYDDETGMLSIVDTVEIHEVDSKQIGSVFQVGDVLVSASLNGEVKQLTRQYHVIDLLLTARVGDTVVFTVLRNGNETQVSVTITQDCLTVY